MGVVFTNNAETTLAAAITSTSATSISVTSSSTFPAIQAGEHFYATLDDGTNNEIVKVTGVSGTTWTVVRASDSTTARTFANGITVQLRATAALLTDIQENIAAKSANQTVYNATAASNATAYDVGVNPGVEANAMVFLDGVMQHHDTFSFSGSTLTFDAAPTNGTKIEVIVDNLINLQSSNLTTDTFTATSGQTTFTLSDAPAAENNLIVFIDGVFQDQGNYSISNHTLTLATGAVVGRTVTVYIINPVNIGTPSDGTVTSAKLSGNITMPGTLTVGAFDVAFDSPTFFVDNANSRVGLGTASPSVPVDIVGDVKMSANLTVDTTTLVVDSTNNKVGIGTSSPRRQMHIHNSASATVGLQMTNGNTGESNDSQGFQFKVGSDSHAEISQMENSDLRIFTNATEAMRIDSSQNLLVDKDDTDRQTVGHEFRAGGFARHTADQSNSLELVRKSNDGDFQRFYKDGSLVGSIGTANSGDLYIGNDDTTLLFAGGSDAIIPRGTAGATRDAAIDLGLSAHRFKDLYLSGTANVGGLTVNSSEVLFDNTGGDFTLKLHTNAVGDKNEIIMGDSGTPLAKFGVGGTANDIITGSDGQDFNIGTAGGGRAINFSTDNFASVEMKLDGGNVGIGATSIDSDSILHLKSNTPNIFFEDTDDNKDWRLEATSVFKLQDVTRGAEVFRFDSSGNVGIGTTSVANILQIAGALGLDHAAMRSAGTTGDFSITVGGLPTLSSSAWKDNGMLVFYTGVDGSLANANMFFSMIRVRGLSTYASAVVSNIVGTATISDSSASSTGLTINFDVGNSNSGSVFVILLGGGANRPTISISG